MDPKTSLRAGYSRTASEYDRTAGEVYLGALRKLLPDVLVAPRPAILDVGSGTGINLFEAARVLGPCERLVGVDLSPGMVASARRNASERGIDAVFLEGDAEALPVESHAFDLVVCNSVYHWFANGRRAVAELSRAVRPGGQIVVTALATPAFEEWTTVVRAAWARVVGDGEPLFPSLPSPTALLDELADEALGIELYRYERRRAHVADVDRFLDSMRVVVPTWLPDAEGAATRVLEATRAALGRGLDCTYASVQAIARRGAPPKNAIAPRLESAASGFGGLGVDARPPPSREPARSPFVGVGSSPWSTGTR
jgi:ubiquinone/menaquinone biosynthesis C-methylase UbiE